MAEKSQETHVILIQYSGVKWPCDTITKKKRIEHKKIRPKC